MAFTFVYVIRSFVRITDLKMRWSTKRPRASISISTENVSRSTRGLSEQMPLDSRSGSMGTARPGKYTDVPRSNASRSSALASVT